jgi:hypothetical protein
VPFYKFGPNDIFHNVIKTYPQCNFFIYSGSVYYNSKPAISGAFTSNVPHTSTGHISLYEINVDRPSGGLVYPFITKDGTLSSFKTISVGDFNNSGQFSYGDIMTGSYPLAASISKDLYTIDAPRNRVDALRNTLNYYTYLSQHYSYSSSFGDKSSQPIGLISIPSIFYGSSIKKGSVKLKYYITGTLAGELQDFGRNGELVETVGTNTNNVAGTVLYNEGFILLTGSWDLDSAVSEAYEGFPAQNPQWIYFGQSINSTITIPSSSFEMEFKGTNPVPVLTMLAHAPIAELNHSANPTYIEHGQNTIPLTSSTSYIENRELSIKNTVSSPYPDPDAPFKKQTFISKIGLYDEKKNLIAIAKVAKPVKKTEDRDFTFKLKLDF